MFGRSSDGALGIFPGCFEGLAGVLTVGWAPDTGFFGQSYIGGNTSEAGSGSIFLLRSPRLKDQVVLFRGLLGRLRSPKGSWGTQLEASEVPRSNRKTRNAVVLNRKVCLVSCARITHI